MPVIAGCRSAARTARRAAPALIGILISAIALSAQTIRSVKNFGPALGNSMSGEVAVVNSTGLVYTGGQSAFGGNVGVIDPNTNAVIKVIQPADTAANMIYSRVNQATSIVYFSHAATPNAKIVAIDGRASSAGFNQEMTPIVFPLQSLVTFTIDQTRNRLYAAARNNSGTQGTVHIVDIDPASATFHQILSSVSLPAGQILGHVAVNTATNKIYVATQTGAGGVSFFDGTAQVLTPIASTQSGGPIVVNEASNTIYAGNTNAAPIQAIDGITNTLTTTIALPSTIAGSLGENIAINPATERVYGILTNTSLAVIDAKRSSPGFNTALANIPNVGALTNSEVAVDQGLNKIVVASGNNLRSSIIDGATNTVVASPAGNYLASDVAINPVTHRAFIGHAF